MVVGIVSIVMRTDDGHTTSLSWKPTVSKPSLAEPAWQSHGEIPTGIIAKRNIINSMAYPLPTATPPKNIAPINHANEFLFKFFIFLSSPNINNITIFSN